MSLGERPAAASSAAFADGGDRPAARRTSGLLRGSGVRFGSR